MPLENLEEEGLPKNPDLRIAQLRFLLSLRPRAPDPAARDELMAAVRLHSECGRSGVCLSGCRSVSRPGPFGGSRLWLPQVSPGAAGRSRVGVCIPVSVCTFLCLAVGAGRQSALGAARAGRWNREGFGHSAVLPRSWLPARLAWLLEVLKGASCGWAHCARGWINK